MKIDSYTFGSMTVDGKVYQNDLIVLADRVIPNWWRKEGHSLSVEDLAKVMKAKPDVLIVGKGASSCMQILPATRKALKEKNIELVEADTEKAVQIFNEKIQRGKNVVGAFHLTC